MFDDRKSDEGSSNKRPPEDPHYQHHTEAPLQRHTNGCSTIAGQQSDTDANTGYSGSSQGPVDFDMMIHCPNCIRSMLHEGLCKCVFEDHVSNEQRTRCRGLLWYWLNLLTATSCPTFIIDESGELDAQVDSVSGLQSAFNHAGADLIKVFRKGLRCNMVIDDISLAGADSYLTARMILHRHPPARPHDEQSQEAVTVNLRVFHRHTPITDAGGVTTTMSEYLMDIMEPTPTRPWNELLLLLETDDLHIDLQFSSRAVHHANRPPFTLLFGDDDVNRPPSRIPITHIDDDARPSS